MVRPVDDAGETDANALEASLATAFECLRHAHLLVVLQGGPSTEPPSDAELFEHDPRAAWARWLPTCRAAFQKEPQVGCGTLLRWAGLAPVGGLVLTSSTDGHWLRSGWPADRVFEVQGNACRLQCSGPCFAETWDAEGDVLVESAQHLPCCQRCSESARPWVRMGPDDQIFFTKSHISHKAAELGALTQLERSSSIILLLELHTGQATFTPEFQKEAQMLETTLQGLGRLIRIRIGPPASKASTLELGELAAELPLEVPEALARIHGLLSKEQLATFILVDRERHAVEIVMPMATPLAGLLQRAIVEVERSDRIQGEPLVGGATHPYHAARSSPQMLGPEQTVETSLFGVMRDGEEPGIMIHLSGLRFSSHNRRMLERILSCRSLLNDIMTSFGTDAYQKRLAAACSQMEIKAMIKEVHVGMLPRHGFPLSADMNAAQTLQMQTRMQTFINSCGDVDNVLGALSALTLGVSGVNRMPTLPLKVKEAGHSAGLVQKSLIVRVPRFVHHDKLTPLVYGTWLGDSRAPAAFIESPCWELTNFLLDDPDGPFAGQVDDWPSDDDTESRWKRWGFKKEQNMLKADWHTLPTAKTVEGEELFVPRYGERGRMQPAPGRCRAFAQAFRKVNQRCFDDLAAVLREVGINGVQDQAATAPLLQALADSFKEQRHLGVVEAQVWWGDRPLRLPSHKDGATSLLHLGVTLGGSRTLRVGTYSAPQVYPETKRAKEPSVWDTESWARGGQLSAGLKDIRMLRGCAYLSAPYCYEHGVQLERGTRENPVIALQCRFAFRPHTGEQLNAIRDDIMWKVSAAIANRLKLSCEAGELRMPSLNEVVAIASAGQKPAA